MLELQKKAQKLKHAEIEKQMLENAKAHLTSDFDVRGARRCGFTDASILAHQIRELSKIAEINSTSFNNQDFSFAIDSFIKTV